jgi:hypothetical protein
MPAPAATGTLPAGAAPPGAGQGTQFRPSGVPVTAGIYPVRENAATGHEAVTPAVTVPPLTRQWSP